jgi:hypothetical protein
MLRSVQCQGASVTGAVAVSHDVTSRLGVPDLLVRERWHVAIGKGQIGCDQKARIA